MKEGSYIHVNKWKTYFLDYGDLLRHLFPVSLHVRILFHFSKGNKENSFFI